MSRQPPKTRLLDLGIDYTPRPRDANYQPTRTMPEFARIRQDRVKNASSFFKTHTELTEIIISTTYDLTLDYFRKIDPAIVMVDTPDPNRYPKEYFIGVSKNRANSAISQLKLQKEIDSVNDEVTPQGMKHFDRDMVSYTIEVVPRKLGKP